MPIFVETGLNKKVANMSPLAPFQSAPCARPTCRFIRSSSPKKCFFCIAPPAPARLRRTASLPLSILSYPSLHLLHPSPLCCAAYFDLLQAFAAMPATAKLMARLPTWHCPPKRNGVFAIVTGLSAASAEARPNRRLIRALALFEESCQRSCSRMRSPVRTSVRLSVQAALR